MTTVLDIPTNIAYLQLSCTHGTILDDGCYLDGDAPAVPSVTRNM
ncbi:hypothetical protein ACFL6S_18950 [Candidatus Poribacteria bacterium]